MQQPRLQASECVVRAETLASDQDEEPSRTAGSLVLPARCDHTGARCPRYRSGRAARVPGGARSASALERKQPRGERAGASPLGPRTGRVVARVVPFAAPARGDGDWSCGRAVAFWLFYEGGLPCPRCLVSMWRVAGVRRRLSRSSIWAVRRGIRGCATRPIRRGSRRSSRSCAKPETVSAASGSVG
jgi:hypothetical protein